MSKFVNILKIKFKKYKIFLMIFNDSWVEMFDYNKSVVWYLKIFVYVCGCKERRWRYRATGCVHPCESRALKSTTICVYSIATFGGIKPVGNTRQVMIIAVEYILYKVVDDKTLCILLSSDGTVRRDVSNKPPCLLILLLPPVMAAHS